MTKPQIIEQDGKPAFVVLPYDEWLQIQALIEDASDAAAVARFRESGEETFPMEVVDRLLAGETPIRVYRSHRGLSQADLAGQAGIAVPYLSQIENGKREPSLAVLRKIATALRVDIDDLVPVPPG